MPKTKPQSVSNVLLDPAPPDDFSTRLLNWFDHHGRHDLPWQINIDAYRVWVSEIMLQQTQVGTVIPYFQGFMQRFPDIQSLASASEDAVLQHWSGLGYYTRARHLRQAAQIVCQQYDGQLPQSIEQLQALPGIGRSTAGAIAAIAYQQHSCILDGNVKRVLARHFAIAGWPGRAAVSRQLWAYAEVLTPQQRVADYTQAIMDLGATVCRRSRPDCAHCPLADSCLAHAEDNAAAYPGRRAARSLPLRQTTMYLIVNRQREVLLQKRPPSGIWAGLWSLPESEATPRHIVWQQQQHWPPLRHTFSHFHLDIQPVECRVKRNGRAVMDAQQWRWHPLDQSPPFGLAAPVKKLLLQLAEQH